MIPDALLSSESDEWYTPPKDIEAVIAVLKHIDLDPCSPYPDGPVPAALHYTIEDNGLIQPWKGRVFMNPPYGRQNPKWCTKLVKEYQAGNVIEAIVLVCFSTETEWFNLLAEVSPLWCAPSDRIKFIPGEGNTKRNSPTKGNAFFYLGHNEEKFIEVFKSRGRIWKEVTS